MTSSGHAHLVSQPASDVAENLEEISCTECTGQGNDFELIPTVKMETRHPVEGLLWPPNRAGHYIFVLWFLPLSSFYLFPRLFSAVADWISIILLHMVWP